MYNTMPSNPGASAEHPGPLSPASLAACFVGCDDFQTRRIAFGLESAAGLTVCWIDGLVSGERVSEDILRPLTEASRSEPGAGDLSVIARILRGAVYRCAVTVRTSLADAAD